MLVYFGYPAAHEDIAARVQGQAEPDEVVINAATTRLVAGLFETEDRGRHELKGLSIPIVFRFPLFSKQRLLSHH